MQNTPHRHPPAIFMREADGSQAVMEPAMKGRVEEWMNGRMEETSSSFLPLLLSSTLFSFREADGRGRHGT
jgi:hypothetical protein